LASPFDGFEVPARLRPSSEAYAFDLNQALSAVVALEAKAPADAFTANSLGTERIGNGTVIGSNGLVLTIGYLITEAEEITLTRNDGSKLAAHALGADPVTGFGLVQALEPLGLPSLPLGDARKLDGGDPVILAGGGGRAHAAAGEVLTRMPFAGYWEYLLDEAIMTEPAHPHWSGAALIGAGGELMGVGSLSLQRQSRSGPKRSTCSCRRTCCRRSSTIWRMAAVRIPRGHGWASSPRTSTTRWSSSASVRGVRRRAPSSRPATPSSRWPTNRSPTSPTSTRASGPRVPRA